MEELLEVFLAGGWSMALIALCLMLELAIIIERSLKLMRASMKAQPFLTRVREQVLAGQLGKAIELASAAEGALARVVKAGLTRAHEPRELIRASVGEAASDELPRLTRRVPVLMGLGMLALLLGLHGTVVELYPRFHCSLGGPPIEGPLLRAAAQFSVALGPAVVGLAVSLVAVVGHALLRAWIRKVEDQIHHGSVMVLNLLQSDR